MELRLSHLTLSGEAFDLKIRNLLVSDKRKFKKLFQVYAKIHGSESHYKSSEAELDSFFNGTFFKFPQTQQFMFKVTEQPIIVKLKIRHRNRESYIKLIA